MLQCCHLIKFTWVKVSLARKNRNQDCRLFFFFYMHVYTVYVRVFCRHHCRIIDSIRNWFLSFPFFPLPHSHYVKQTKHESRVYAVD